MSARIAIIGAGMAGLSAAHKLKDHAEIIIFDKGRGVSGRLATRYADDVEFDHGAQYFTVKSEAFQAFLKPALEAGYARPWNPVITRYVDRKAGPDTRNSDALVGAPRMNDLGKFFAQNFDVRLRSQIVGIEKDGEAWALKDADGTVHAPFDWVIVTAPATQSQALMPLAFAHHDAMKNVKMNGCFTLMVGLSKKPDLSWDGAFVESSPIGWLAMNHTKPGRGDTPALIIQSTNGWGEANLDENKAAVEKALLSEARAITGLNFSEPVYQSLHRWRYASVQTPADKPCLVDTENHLVACGDWCIKGRVEGAFESGTAAGAQIAAHL